MRKSESMTLPCVYIWLQSSQTCYSNEHISSALTLIYTRCSVQCCLDPLTGFVTKLTALTISIVPYLPSQKIKQQGVKLMFQQRTMRRFLSFHTLSGMVCTSQKPACLVADPICCRGPYEQCPEDRKRDKNSKVRDNPEVQRWRQTHTYKQHVSLRLCGEAKDTLNREDRLFNGPLEKFQHRNG